MKAEYSYKFTFSREEVNAINKTWEFMSDMEDYEYNALLKQAGIKNFSMTLKDFCVSQKIIWSDKNISS